MIKCFSCLNNVCCIFAELLDIPRGRVDERDKDGLTCCSKAKANVAHYCDDRMLFDVEMAIRIDAPFSKAT